MGQLLSACGIFCDECSFYNNDCQGCYAVSGSTFWAVQYVPDKVCALYNCAVNKNNFRSCGDCSELPCKTFKDQKDPETSIEEHVKAIHERVDRLRGN
jgi:hypothetical protein